MNKPSFLGTLVALLVITLQQQGEYLPLECWETDAHQLSWKSGHLGAALCPETPDVQRPQKTYPEPWLEQGQEPGWIWCFPWGGRACRFNGERGAVSEEMGEHRCQFCASDSSCGARQISSLRKWPSLH